MRNSESIEFPLDFKKGLGYSPNSGPAVGGAPSNPGRGFYGQSMESILPNGSTPTSNMHFFGKKKKRFGKTYPLMNLPSRTINMSVFPKPPVGPGNTPGGSGGPNAFPVLPNTVQYWGYGKPRSRRKRRSRHSRKPRKSRSRKLRRSRPRKLRRSRSKRPRKSRSKKIR